MIADFKKKRLGLFSTVVCPITRTNLKYNPDTQELISEAASLAFPIRNGVPILLIDEARNTDPLSND
jgi:hypothetical protein